MDWWTVPLLEPHPIKSPMLWKLLGHSIKSCARLGRYSTHAHLEAGLMAGALGQPELSMFGFAREDCSIALPTYMCDGLEDCSPFRVPRFGRF